jgi:hypothetical protein
MSEKKTAMEGDDVQFNSVTATVNTGTVVKNKYDGTADPTINDDVNAGYSAGSRFLNATEQSWWVCMDPSAGAAVWVKMAGVASSTGTGGALVVASPQIMVISAVSGLVFEDSEYVVENYQTA